MMLKRLESIFDLRSEINLLAARMNRYYKKGDFVGDYGLNPNRGNAFTIQGTAIKDAPKLEKLKEQYKTKIAELEEKIKEAKVFIDNIPDTNVRVLLSARFVDGMTWKQAAKLIYKNMSESSARMCVKRYFEDN